MSKYEVTVSDPEKMDGAVKFLVTVQTDLPEYASNPDLKVRRRFNDFIALHETLSREVALPQPPAKTLFVTDKVNQERTEAFGNIMKTIAKDPALRTSPVVAEFLGIKLDPPKAIATPSMQQAPESAKEEVEKPEVPAPVASWNDNPLEDLLALVNAPEKTSADSPPPKPTAASSPAKPASVTPAKPKPTSSAPKSNMFKAFDFNLESGAEAASQFTKSGEGLREAIKSGNTEAVRHLLKEKVDPNFRDQQGMTVLHVASLFNRTDIAIVLLEAGADAHTKNGQGETPLDCAPVMLSSKMQDWLKANGRTL